MATIQEIKEREIADTPLFLFECQFSDGSVERWSTHRVTVDGQLYADQVKAHNAVEARFSASETAEWNGRMFVRLWNLDGYASQVQAIRGFRGARLKVSFVFFDLANGEPTSELRVIFRGVGNAPDEINEVDARISFTDRLSHQRVVLPAVRVQKRCGWRFPRTAGERAEAVSGGVDGKYSTLYSCGYSAGENGGVGNLDSGGPFVSCDGTRSQCVERGMFDQDAQGRTTARFGGFGFVPASTIVRSHGEKGRKEGAASANESLHDDAVPLVYGTVWMNPGVVFSRNDGNLTRMECLVGYGELESVNTVVVNGYEIPAGIAGQDMTATGWYNIASRGLRNGSPNLEMTDSNGAPIGDPHGSLYVISVNVPNRLVTGGSTPRVQALVKGQRLDRFDNTGEPIGEAFTNNPAWVALDLLRRCGWELADLDLPSFSLAAAKCEEPTIMETLGGGVTARPRYQCNMWIPRRRSAADLLRGVRTGAQMGFRYSDDGLLGIRVEGTLAEENAVKPAGSNSVDSLNGGWPAYEFSDGSGPFSGILRRPNGESSVRFFGKANTETYNRISIEFQNEFNDYQQDSLSLVDRDDVYLTRQESSTICTALGVPNFDQASRVLSLQMRKSSTANLFVEFETSVRGVGLRPGDLITLTYAKDGMVRQLFRVAQVNPDGNFYKCRIVAQVHDDVWYSEAADGKFGERREFGTDSGVPRPLIGNEVVEGELQLSVDERVIARAEGESVVSLTIGFATPTRPITSRAEIPIVDLFAMVTSDGGDIDGPSTWFYQVCGVDGDGVEGRPSFTVSANVSASASTNRVTITGLRFGPKTVSYNVYRGPNPLQLYRIASNQPVSAEFHDSRAAMLDPIAPPDRNFSHANIYWRFERLPEIAVMTANATSVTNTTTALLPDEHVGSVVRISAGKGNGQERRIISNTESTVIVNPSWGPIPDASSKFIIADPGWVLGTVTDQSPAVFEVPNRTYAGINILARSAGFGDIEAPAELSPFRRWTLGESSGGTDSGVPPVPQFSLVADGDGSLEIEGLGFLAMQNTRGIHAATLWLWFWDERDGAPTVTTVGETGTDSTEITLSEPVAAVVGQLLQLGAEVARVDNVVTPNVLRVTRRVSNSGGGMHPSGTTAVLLKPEVQTIAFPKGFFGSPASGSYSWRVELPCVRVVAADLVMTNGYGNGLTRNISFGSTSDGGLRTLRGGQITLDVDGFLAIQDDATPPFVVDSYYSIRDIRAMLNEPASGGLIELNVLRNEAVIAVLVIPDAHTFSNVVDGLALGPLAPGDRMRLNVVSVPSAWNGLPGKDLSVSIRT